MSYSFHPHKTLGLLLAPMIFKSSQYWSWFYSSWKTFTFISDKKSWFSSQTFYPPDPLSFSSFCFFTSLHHLIHWNNWHFPSLFLKLSHHSADFSFPKSFLLTNTFFLSFLCCHLILVLCIIVTQHPNWSFSLTVYPAWCHHNNLHKTQCSLIKEFR